MSRSIDYLSVKVAVMTVSDKPEDRGTAPATEFVAGWTQTETLTALRELLDVSARVRPTVAHRTGLTQSELVALEHLIRGPIGPAEVARLLGVTTAAATGIVDRLAGRGHGGRGVRSSGGPTRPTGDVPSSSSPRARARTSSPSCCRCSSASPRWTSS